jgi:starch-binding outer membrane protein, SusD/RagB family
MIMKKIVSILSITIFLLMSACNDGILDKLPETAIGAENFFKSEEDLKMYIYNLYSFPGVVIYTNDGYNSTDNASNTAISEMKSIMLHSNPTSETFGSGWSWGALRRANFFLQYFRNNNLPEDVLVHYEGLARFFRARFYMEMVKRYSDVPWYDQIIGTSDEDLLYKERDPRAMVVEKIFEDYDFASKNVRAVQPVGAINKWAVLAFMSRDALYEGTYRKYHPELQLGATAGTYLTMAATTAKQIMDNGGFNIYSTGNVENDYANMFISTSLAGNPEVIFVNISEDGVKNSGWSNYWHDYEVSPAKDLVNAYLMKDGTFYSSQPGFETKMFVDEFTNRDPRLKQTVNYPGWVYARTANPYVFPGSLSRYFTGYHLLKGFQNHTDQVRSNSVDVPLFRYAETLLIYAESKAEMGQLSQADLDLTINKLRQRVGMPAMAMNPPVDPVKEAKYPTVKSSAQWREILEIRRERRVELAMEGYRFDDLMRWGAGKVLEKPPVGLYLPGPGKYDTTGDGIPDIKILPLSATIPAAVANREKNSLGVTLLYYRIGPADSAAEVFVTDGDKGYIIGEKVRGTFVEPKYYYRPVPRTQTVLNPNLKQIFGWE